jgi:GT2 family glycosyltransferase
MRMAEKKKIPNAGKGKKQATQKVSVIVLNWNGKQFLKDCFSTIFSQDYPDFEVIMVDNGSTDGSQDYVRKSFPKVRLIQNPTNYGFAKANNQGMEIAKGRYIVCLNNDIKLEKNFLSELVHAAEQDRRIGMVAPKMVYFDTPEIDTIGVRLFSSGLSWDTKDESLVAQVVAPCGGAVLYRKEMLEDIKLEGDYFDSDFIIYCEDLDLGLRAVSRGWKYAYCRSAVVHHLHSATMKGKKDMTIRLTHRNNVWVLIKNLPTMTLLKKSVWIILAQLFAILVYLPKGKAILVIKAKFEALGQLKRFLRKRKLIAARRTISRKEFEGFIQKRIFPGKSAL